MEEYRVFTDRGSMLIGAESAQRAKELAENDGYRVRAVAKSMIGYWEIVLGRVTEEEWNSYKRGLVQ